MRSTVMLPVLLAMLALAGCPATGPSGASTIIESGPDNAPSARDVLTAAVGKLRRHAAITVDRFEVGSSDASDEIATLKQLDAAPAGDMEILYSYANGFTLLWHGTVQGQAVDGSLNFLNALASGLRAPLREGGEPLEGILWTTDTPEPARSLLRRMTIIESVDGRDEFITQIPGEDPQRVYFVREWAVIEFPLPLSELVPLLLRFAGSSRVREHLLHPDWEERIANDVILMSVFD